jgi:hypothetical protein
MEPHPCASASQREAIFYARHLTALTDIRFHMSTPGPASDPAQNEILREQLLEAYQKLVELLSTCLVDSLSATQYLRNFFDRIPASVSESISAELAKRDLGNLFERQNNNIISMADGLRDIFEAEQAQYAAHHPNANQRSTTTARLDRAAGLGQLNGFMGVLQSSLNRVEQKIEESH